MTEIIYHNEGKNMVGIMPKVWQLQCSREDQAGLPKPHLGILGANYALLLLGVHSQLSPGESH